MPARQKKPVTPEHGEEGQEQERGQQNDENKHYGHFDHSFYERFRTRVRGKTDRIRFDMPRGKRLALPQTVLCIAAIAAPTRPAR